MTAKNTQPRIVIMGGGTGIYPVTTALKHLPVIVSTVVAVSDSGGSTGRIRDEFGFQPVGDLRQSLAALAEGEGQEWIRKLLLYRFDKGNGLKGHNLGNLILTALQDMTGDTAEALQKATTIFSLTGQVIPAANEVVDIQITYDDGSTQIGEDYLNHESSLHKPVSSISLVPAATATPAALKAINEASLIIIGPGDYYASLLATLLPQGMTQAVSQSSAHIVVINNLMTRRWQTDGMDAAAHIAGLEKYLGREVDTIIMNNSKIPAATLAAYEAFEEHPVVDDLDGDKRVIRADVIATPQTQTAAGDALLRSYLRHDSQKLLNVLQPIIDQLQSP